MLWPELSRDPDGLCRAPASRVASTLDVAMTGTDASMLGAAARMPARTAEAIFILENETILENQRKKEAASGNPTF